MPDDVEQDGGFREALSQSWAKIETPAETPAVKADAPPAPTPVETQAKPETASDGPVRDEKGRFAPKEAGAASNGTPPARTSASGTQEVAAEAPGPPAVAAPAAPPAPVSELKAPQSWTPAEREEFAKAPQAVQKAALRREAEIAKALNETAEPRKLKEAVAPYEHLFRQAGMSAPQGINSLLQTYAALTTAPPQVRADIIAELVTTRMGTDEAAISLLAAAIDKRTRGGGGTNGAPAQVGFDPGQVQAMIRQHLEQERYNATREQAVSVLQQFQATQPEFLETPDATEKPIRDTMGLILSDWERKNPSAPVSIDIFQQAYDKACKINDDVAKVLQQREQAKAAANANASTQKAKLVSGSVKSQPGGPAVPPPPGDDTRSHMAASWDRLAGQ